MSKLENVSVSSGAMLMSDLVRYRPRLALATFLLMLARSLSEGVTFLLLIPLLGFAGALSPGEGGVAMPQGLERLQAMFPVRPSIETVMVLFLIVIIARAMLGYASTMAANIYQSGFVEHVRARLYRAMSRASWMHLAGGRQAHDMNALTAQTESVGVAAQYTVNIAAGCLTILTGLSVAFTLSPRLTLAILLASLALAAPMLLYQRWAYARGAASLEAVNGLYSVLLARLNGLKLAKAFAIERELEADFAASSQRYQRAMLAFKENIARATLLQEIATAVVLAVLVYVALGSLKATGLELILLIMIFARLAPLVSGALYSMRSLAGTLPAYVALREREAEARAAEEPLPDGAERLELRRAVALEGVGFSYPGHEAAPILAEVSLSIAAGSAVGLIGLSGAGKSTLADMIAGLTPPTQGDVLVDGIRLDALARARWRASVAYVPQDAPLFHDTLRENLRIAARGATDAEIWEVLDMVQAADLVRKLPQGLDTEAGERGVRLSGGERQRIRLASALLRRPQLLILDESTSALNPADEARVIAAVQQLRGAMTILMIAHRTSSVDWTDRVLFVQEGRIVADGTPSEVLSEAGMRLDLARATSPPTKPEAG